MVFYDVGDPLAPVELSHLAFERPGPGQSPATKRWTAGAVGLVATGTDYLLGVGSWGSAQIDVYRSSSADLRDSACRFTHVAQWSEEGADKGEWIDGNWGGYQSLNLFAGGDGRIFVVGGHRNAAGQDWIDLYELHLDRAEPRRVRKLAKRHLFCHEGASFRWAGGFVSEGGILHAIAAERDLHTRTTVNLFEGPGGLGTRERARFVANRNTRETHSLADPCAWVDDIAPAHRLLCRERPPGYFWCDYCFPALADG